MTERRDRIPIRLRDQPEDQASLDTTGPIYLGEVVSSQGVGLVTVDCRHNEDETYDLVTSGWLFHTAVTPAKGVYRIDSGPERTTQPFNFFPPGTPLNWRMEHCVVSTCAWGADFTRKLTDNEPGLNAEALNVVWTSYSPRLTELSRRLHHETLSPGFGSSLIAEALAIEIVVEVVRCDHSLRPDEPILRGGLPAWQMKRLESYVQEHLGDDLSLESLASVLGITTRHLSRVIKREKGESVHRWVARLRLEEAKRLLTLTPLSLHDIARRVAFASAASFSTAFRTACGMPPSEYRRLAQG